MTHDPLHTEVLRYLRFYRLTAIYLCLCATVAVVLLITK